MPARRDASRARDLATLAFLAALTYLPLLVQGRGRLAADTRQAVYLDPGRFLSDALSMWDPSRDLGTVTHQNIVVVWPMGAWYRIADLVGLPLWTAQRLWVATILFAAGAGVLFLARSIGWGCAELGPAVAAVVYATSPYVVQYGNRTSVLLIPWAALPWVLGLTDRALRTGGWRHPALLALVVPLMAVNATALVLVLLGPAVWVAWAVLGERGERRVPLRSVGGPAARTALLGVAASAWWVVALGLEGRYGLPLLDFTETIDQVASTSSATEVLRGLGYWVPYLQQHGYPEVSGAGAYLDRLPVLALQLGIVGVVFVAAHLLRWRHRGPFVVLLALGVVIGVGAYPPAAPGPLASTFSDLARSGGIGLALRSTTRAAPLAVLAAACLLGALVDAAGRVRPRAGIGIGLALVVVTAGLAPAFHGQLVDPLYSRPDPIPGYWQEAIDAADAGAGDGRLLELPGTRYAAYRWGNTYEPITAGLAETPTAWREQIPYGGAGSAELLVALDTRVQEGRLAPEALAPVARLLGASEIVLRNDLAYERYDTVAPDRVWSLFDPAPEGLGPAAGFGPVGVNVPDPTRYRPDQSQPADPTATYPAVAVVPVLEPTGLVRRIPLAGTVVLDGDADGLVEAAAAGAIDGVRPVVLAASTPEHPQLLEELLASDAEVVLTDTNRRRVERWRSIRNTVGITLTADEDPAALDGGDGGEAALDVFGPAEGDPAWQTVAEPGGAHVTATRYGNPLWFEAARRPAAALDGDPATAWLVGPTIGGIGDRLDIDLDEPVRTDRLTLRVADEPQRVSAVDVRFDGGPPVRVALGPEAASGPGHEVTFPSRLVDRVSIELVATEPRDPGAAASSIGIAEVGIAAAGGAPVVVDEVVRLPTALVEQLGRASADLALRIVLTRLVGDAADPALHREEPDLRRRFTLPTARTFAVVGRAAGSTAAATCRDDLLTVDGEPVALRLLDGGAVEACAPLVLTAGEHELRSSLAAGADLDQLTLTSAAGGGAGALGADGRPQLDPPADEPAVVTGEGLTHVDVDSEAADGASWLLLAQSRNDGWEASAGGDDLGGPILLNGFANGFLVPSDLAAATDLQLDWAPQRSMRLALVLAGAAMAVCLALAVRGRRWVPALPDPAAGAPRLRLPGTAAPLALAPAGAVAAAAALAGAALLGAPGGLLLGALAGVGARWRSGPSLLAGASGLAIAGACSAVVLDRLERRDALAFDFFTSLHGPHRLAIAAVVLLVVATLVPRSTDDGAGPAAAGLRRWWGDPLATAPDGPGAPASRDDRRRYARTAGGVVAVGTVAFVVLLAGSGGLFEPRPSTAFYDAQAHSLLDGRLDVDADVLGIEGFRVGDRTFMYQGPFPALLRLPVAALTDDLDGRLTGVSMAAAFAVAGAAIAVLLWQGRRLVRGGAPLGSPERWATAATVLAATAGSSLLTLAGQVSVYHEGALWGVACSLAALAAVLQHRIAPRRRHLVLAALATVAALGSRASVGVGPVVALGLLALGELLALRGPSRPAVALRPPGPAAWRRAGAAVLAAALPVVLYCGLNVAKFGTLASVPWDDQVFSSVSSSRQEFLARNEGSFFGAGFVPSNLLAYLRPDGIALLDHPPYLGFRTSAIGTRDGIGGALFDKVDATASIPSTSPLLLLLAAAGGAVALRSRGRGPAVASVGPALGAAAASATIVVFGFTAQRYLPDALPLLVVLAALGLPAITAALDGAGPRARRATAGVGGALVAGSVATAVALGLTYQAVYASPGTPAAAVRYVDIALDGPHLPAGRGLTVRQGTALPATGAPEDLFVVGDCDGLYISDGSVPDELTRTNWKPVLRTPAVGAHDLDVTFAALAAGTLEPLLVSGTARAPAVLAVEHLGRGEVRFRFRGGGLEDVSEPVRVGTGRHRLQVAADPGTGLLDVVVDGRTRMLTLYPSSDVPVLGTNRLDDSTTARFVGELEPRPADLGLCRRALGSG